MKGDLSWPRAALAVVAGVTGAVLVVNGAAQLRPPVDVPGPRSAAELGVGVPAPSPPSPSSASPSSASPASPSTPPSAVPVGLGPSRPVQLLAPSIGLLTRLDSIGVTGDGRLAVPPARGGLPAYWYRLLASPGEPGPAVLVGHVDSVADGPGVFFRLAELRPGDEMTVRRADGTAPRFVVRQVARYPKSAFPVEAVYGPTVIPTLRLVTCGGTFDGTAHSYRDNVVVYADLLTGP